MKPLNTLFILVMLAAPVWAQQGAVEDSLVVGGKAVVFFGPSNDEYLAMTHEEKDAIDEQLYDFLHYRKKVLPFLKENAIQEFLTALPKIEIRIAGAQSLIFTRRDFNHVVGLIMTDGKNEPELFLGAATQSELIGMFEKYFGLH